jgi:hypothetical protein
MLAGVRRATLLLILVMACGTAEERALLEAARHYVAAETGVSRFELQIVRMTNDYARLHVTPVVPRPDPAVVYMKKEAGTWRGLFVGTGLAEEDLREIGIPESLWEE